MPLFHASGAQTGCGRCGWRSFFSSRAQVTFVASVPVLVFSPYMRAGGIAEFGEAACLRGSLGMIPATHIMPIALANAQRIAKYAA
jgi:hypothetical protein